MEAGGSVRRAGDQSAVQIDVIVTHALYQRSVAGFADTAVAGVQDCRESLPVTISLLHKDSSLLKPSLVHKVDVAASTSINGTLAALSSGGGILESK